GDGDRRALRLQRLHPLRVCIHGRHCFGRAGQSREGDRRRIATPATQPRMRTTTASEQYTRCGKNEKMPAKRKLRASSVERLISLTQRRRGAKDGLLCAFAPCREVRVSTHFRQVPSLIRQRPCVCSSSAKCCWMAA